MAFQLQNIHNTMEVLRTYLLTHQVGVRYDEFLRTCLSATEVPIVAAAN